MKKIIWAIGFTAITYNFIGCGSKEEGKDDTPPTVYATIKVENSKTDGEDGSHEFTGASCIYDSGTGIFVGSFTGSSKKTFEVDIRNFSKENGTKTYNCLQSSVNVSGDVAKGKYDNCAVYFNVKSKESNKAANSYSIHRVETEMEDFTYAGECSVEVTYNSTGDTASGKVNCTKMLQTHYIGAVNIRLDDPYTADLGKGTEFECKVK